MHRNVRYDFDNEEVLYKLDGIKALAFFAEVSTFDLAQLFLSPLPHLYYRHEVSGNLKYFCDKNLQKEASFLLPFS